MTEKHVHIYLSHFFLFSLQQKSPHTHKKSFYDATTTSINTSPLIMILDVLDTLGVKAVGLRRRLPLANFFTWFLSAPRDGYRPIISMLVAGTFLFLTYGSYARLSLVVEMETLIFNTMTPVVTSTRQIFGSFHTFFEHFKSHETLHHENQHLRLQNENLLKDNLALKQQIFIHRDIQKSLGIIPTSSSEVSFFKDGIQGIVLSYFSPVHPLFISHSNEVQIEKNSIAVGARGILGRVQRVGKCVSKVITILNPTFSVPVQVRGVQAIAKGNGGHTMTLHHIQEGGHTLHVGDIIYTSGFGGIYPKAIPVGTITFVEKQKIEVTPFETGERLHTTILLPPVKSPLTHTESE